MLTQLIQLITCLNTFFDSWKKVIVVVGFSFLFFVGSLASPQISSMFSKDYISSINDRIHINTPVMEILNSAQESIKANRIVIAELHDGKSNVSGVKFAFVSATYEVVQPGTAKLLLDMQNLPTSMFTGYWKELGQGECRKINVNLENIERNENAVEASYAAYGVDYAIICPIFQPNTDLILGVITGFWNKDINNISEEHDIKVLQSNALILSGILSGKSVEQNLFQKIFGA